MFSPCHHLEVCATHITKRTDFSLRLLIYLAVQPKRIYTIREVSAASTNQAAIP